MTDDKIILQGMVFYAYHGATQEEETLGQRFIVDLELTADLSKPGGSDQLSDAIDYAKVYRTTRSVVQQMPRHQLIEALATTLATMLLDEFPIEAVMVRIKKPGVPLPGVLEYAAVEITRRRG